MQIVFGKVYYDNKQCKPNKRLRKQPDITWQEWVGNVGHRCGSGEWLNDFLLGNERHLAMLAALSNK